MILHPDPRGWAAIRQSSHALLAFQIADHWGNRQTPRPSPRAEVLTAVLLHDAGWDEREDSPRRGPDGVPLAFDSWPADERVELWRAAVSAAAPRGRYVEYLVSHHVASLAERSSTGAFGEFVAAEEARRAALRTDLDRDPRYAQTFATGADEVNRAVVRLADAIAVQLSMGAAVGCALPGLPTPQGEATLQMDPAGCRTYRLRPWPLAGRRLALSAEAVILPRVRFDHERELQEAWALAPRQRLTWLLLAPGAPVQSTPSD